MGNILLFREIARSILILTQKSAKVKSNRQIPSEIPDFCPENRIFRNFMIFSLFFCEKVFHFSAISVIIKVIVSGRTTIGAYRR